MAYTPPAAKSTGDTLSAAEFNTLAAAVDSVDANVVTTLTLAGGITGSKPAGSNTLTLDTNALAPKASIQYNWFRLRTAHVRREP